MTKEAYELLMKILEKRAEQQEGTDAGWVYRNVKDMVELAQQDNLECLSQYDY